MAEVAGLGLAVFSALDTCLKYGPVIIKKYKDFKEAQNEIEERVTFIEATWIKISQQLGLLKRVWDSLDEDYRDLQERIIRILQTKLEAAVSQISKLEKRAFSIRSGQDRRKAARYSLDLKASLDNAIQDLQIWETKFDPTWYLILRGTNPTIDNSLAKFPATNTLSLARHIRDSLRENPQRKASIFLPENKLLSARRSKIPLSTFEICETTDSSTFILDSVECDPLKDASTFAKDVRALAQKLQSIDPFQFNLLDCKGVVRIKDPMTQKSVSFNFIFRMPKNHQRPRSLRSHLYERNYSLSQRVNLAKQLATSVSYLHVFAFVHKGIRPETVLVLQGDNSHFLSLFLLGFKTFRTAEGKTMRLGNSEWAENVYQHPERQGTSPIADYIMQHDIYSLGVCLLEIGLWESLVTREGHINLPSTNENIDPSTLARDGLLKDRFTKMAKEILPHKMGEKYAQVVVNCLTCMDDTNEDFGDISQFEDEDGIFIGVKYIEKVCNHSKVPKYSGQRLTHFVADPFST
ncbi:unnamed protein product [Penicillium salamii]|uniref:Protein kinase domain-containing protein n=1 Tax=Penicillium salamii TaxID=1612424 RepID=A0A9W4ITY7_9EURO|nr:unnamed protein product [Penicillium salamii]CAG8148048.1 unnamed protein product [Penicillium salamii]CAG8150056.1 unnamed protein product [Penicillium salamii]CAG8223965.1 unnamed protein product [Penicillium salamii]CAG8264915.1 unnamed protein product [Penicillium salamii]